jgi:hypothetical protein
MIPPDQEIYEVERRIALRRSQLVRHSREAGRRSLRLLTSPVALIGAGVLGFVVAGGFSKKKKEPPHPERRKSDHMKAAKATGVAGVLTPLLMWMIKAQWGSPVNLAMNMLEKFQKRGRGASPRSDARLPKGGTSPKGEFRSTTRTIGCP